MTFLPVIGAILQQFIFQLFILLIMEGVLKKLRIQTGIVKRISKEKFMYEKEILALQQQVEDMQASGKDEYDIKKRKECLEESRMMIPDCEKRLEAAIGVMRSLLEQNSDCSNEEIYQNAKTALAEVQTA